MKALTIMAAMLVASLAYGQNNHVVAVPLMLAPDSDRQSFVRIINETDNPAEVHITAVDDAGTVANPIEIRLAANQSFHFNSYDLANGNSNKGIDRIGRPRRGDWRLSVEAGLEGVEGGTEDLQVLAFVRTSDGFLTAMHDVLPRGDDGRYLVRMFNPGSNDRQVSKLRLVNTGGSAESVSIAGMDDQGNNYGPVTLTLNANQSRTLSAQELENGAHGLRGTLGDGRGKWRLFVTAEDAVVAMSLLDASSGHLSNISTMGVGPARIWHISENDRRDDREGSSFDTAINLAANGRVSGEIDDADESDYYRIRVSGSGTLTVHSGGSLDTEGYLYDGNRRELASDDDGGTGTNFRIEREVDAGTYYVRVDGYGSNTGSYTVHSEFSSESTNRLVPEALPSVGLLKSTVDTYTESMAEFTLDIFAVTADSELIALRAADLEIRNSTDDNNTIYNFQQLSVRQHTQSYLGPYSATFLMDQSGSISDTDPNDARIEAARVFLDNLASGDEVALMAFAAGGKLPYEPVTAYQDSSGNSFTANAGGFDSALDTLAAAEDGGTPLYDAILRALTYTRQRANNANRAVLVFTDGEDTESNASMDDATDAAVRMGIPLHTVALSSGVNEAVLSQLAGKTDGSMTKANDARELISYYGALGPFLSGSSRFYRTKWRMNLSGGTMRFDPGASVQYGMIITLPNNTVKWLPFRVTIPATRSNHPQPVPPVSIIKRNGF